MASETTSPSSLLTDNLPLLAGTPNGIQKLRELILELAVRGKLVPQDPNDEPASELLKHIAEEKARLSTRGELKKQKALSADEAEEPFELPHGWSWVRLGEITEASTGHAFKSSEYKTVGTFVLRVTNIKPDGSIDLSDCKYIDSSEAMSTYSSVLLKQHDILLVMVGGSLGKIGVVDGSCLPAVLNQNMWKMFRSEFLSKDYFVFGLKFINSTQLKITSSTHGHLAQGDYLSKLFPLAPLAEQHRIVAKVDELMALCDRLEAQQADAESAHARLVQALLDSLTQASDADDFAASWQRLAEHFHTLFTTESSIDALKQTLLQLAVMGKLVPQDPNDEPASELLKRITMERINGEGSRRSKRQVELSEIDGSEKKFELPVGWEWVRLQQIVSVTSGDGLVSAKMNPEGSVPVYGGNGITGYHDRQNVEKETLVIGRVGYYCGSIHLTPASAWVTDNALIVSFSEENLDKSFLFWLLKGTNLKELENATAQPVISGRKIYPIVLAIPPLAEQPRIVAKLNQLMALCDQFKARLTQARQLNEQLATALVEQAVA
ncbi:restriction endonuclease subunit S [Pseudomonas lutea]|uniref:Restriction endonuclease subunit S n=2 Tax=Pseudomonas luteola TaxID=47886 RepID=A0ABS0MYN2_PSELU|nr:restriction endonuclease subunit S [Pseudomonas luteola]